MVMDEEATQKMSLAENTYKKVRKQEKKEPPRRSQNKAKSSLGPGEHPKQYSESVGPSSTEVAISIQSTEDEKAIQCEASRIHKKYV